MCGIFGYIGEGNASAQILKGLKRLEYRGYDSWGVAVLDKKENEIDVFKQVGPIGEVLNVKSLDGAKIGIGHTRWATHGGVTDINAHPHYSTDESFVLAQNGIVENYQELKLKLEKLGYKFKSQTDTEVIVRLVEEKLKYTPDLRQAIRLAFLDLEGRNTIIVLSKADNQLIAVRNGSPLVVGVGKEEYFFASDTLSFSDRTNDVIYINDYQMVEYIDGKIKLSDVKTDKSLKCKVVKLDHGDVTVDKEGFEHFMHKEICEQSYTIKNAARYDLEEIQEFVNVIKSADRVYTVGAGTASYAAGQIAYFLRTVAGVNATELRSYELSGYENVFKSNDVLIAVSQSGETADTVESIEIAKKKGVKIASIVNMLGSTITRLSDYPFFLRSGPEISVVSTKAFTAMCSWGIMLAYAVKGDIEKGKKSINKLGVALEKYFEKNKDRENWEELVQKMKNVNTAFILGKGQNFYIGLEGALKLKETAYKHAEGFAAGELKHGVIALIEKGTPVFVIVSEDEHKNDILSAAAEVKARGAYLVGIAKEENELFDFCIKIEDAGIADSIANIIPFHLLAYHLAVELGYSPDKPRNLAKSVTVK